MIGTSLGPYKIIEQLGAGGMGEVYLGEDTRLGRKVAIKVLPPEFASDPERLARFEQEARAAAALNHPHIAVVHDVGSEPGEDGTPTHFMVQEYLEGQGLRERLDRGAVPLDKALSLAIEIDEALVAAHKAGIVHRDLKPDNIFVTEEGHAKVLDFGLAKLTEMAAPTGSSASMSPTMLGTVAGQVMGTAGYMAPEQVNGEEVDHRADLFAFGCVLYGMVTGREPFSGKNVHETLSRILSEEPAPVAEIDKSLPPDLQRIVRKALAKDVSRRYQTAGDLGADLRQLQDDIAAGVAVAPPAVDAAATVAASESSTGIPWKFAIPTVAVAAILAALGSWLATRSAPPVPGLYSQFEIELPESVDFSFAGSRLIAVSPDGSRIVFVADRQLWMRRIGELEATRIPGTEMSRSPFFSPGGEEIGFFTSEPDNRFMRVNVAGGTPIQVAEVPNFASGASWAANDMIYFGQNDGIYEVAAAGGTLPEKVIGIEEDEVVWGPQLLPGDEWILYTLADRGAADETRRVVARSLVSEELVVLVPEGTDARWLPTGHLVYALEGTLLAVPFDPGVIEPPTGADSMVAGVRMSTGSAANYDVARNGMLVYVPGGANVGGTGFQLAWVDRNDSVVHLPFAPEDSFDLDLSPDGQRIAVVIEGDDGVGNIWIYETERGGSRVLLTTEGDGRSPVWSHDGDWVFFASQRGGNQDIWKRRWDKSLDAEPVLDTEASVRPKAISADGTKLLVTSVRTGGNADVGILALDTAPELEMLLESPAYESAGDFSPDGGFFTYSSNESGQLEVYAMEVSGGRSFPVSTNTRGGVAPRWSRAANEIYYYAFLGNGLLKAGVDTERLQATEPVQISDIVIRRTTNFDVTEDGLRFLVTTRQEESGGAANTPHIIVVLNWFEELKELVPAGR